MIYILYFSSNFGILNIYFTHLYFICFYTITFIYLLLYNFYVFQKQPQFSLFFMGLFMAELVYDTCDAIEMLWYLFGYLQLQTALLHATGILLLICKFLYLFSLLFFFIHLSFFAFCLSVFDKLFPVEKASALFAER